jgi:N-acetylmuramoyl-L-alanine amidase
MCVRRPIALLALVSCLSLTACLGDDPKVQITGGPNPTTSTTAAPVAKRVDTAPQKPLVLPEPGTLAVRTPSGVLALWLGTDGNGGALVRTPCDREASVRSFEIPAQVDVVIDPGHGGIDPGASSSTGVDEAELNLDVALRVRDLLVSRGISVQLTREGDYFRTIADRAAIGASLRPRAFVSIHHNGGTHPPAGLGPGTEAYHEREDAESRRLAGILFEDVVASLSHFDIDWVASRYRGAVWRADRDGDDFYGLLRRADTVPAVILEAAYMSGEAEAQLMTGEEFRAAEAAGIASGIERWLRTADAGTGYVDGFTLGGSARSFDLDECDDPPLE